MLVVERFPDADVAQVTEDVEAALAAMSAGLTGITVETDVYRPAGYLESGGEPARASPRSSGWRSCCSSSACSPVLADGADRLRRRSRRRWSPPCSCCDLGDAPLTTMTLLGLAAVTALVVDDVVGDVAAVRTRARERRAAGQSAVGRAARRRGARAGGARWPTRPSSRSSRSSRCCS